MKRYTKEGFLKSRVPEWLWRKIVLHYRRADFQLESQQLTGFSLWKRVQVDDEECRVGDFFAHSLFSAMPEELKAEVVRVIQPLAEEWSSQKLQFSILYGFRRYVRGNRLLCHTDKSSNYAN